MDCDICYETVEHIYQSKQCCHYWCITCHKRMIHHISYNFPCPFCRTLIRKKKKRKKDFVRRMDYRFIHEISLDQPFCAVSNTIKNWRQRRCLKRSWRSHLKAKL